MGSQLIVLLDVSRYAIRLVSSSREVGVNMPRPMESDEMPARKEDAEKCK